MGKKKTDYVNIAIPVEVYQHLQQAAAVQGVTMEAILAEVVKQVYSQTSERARRPKRPRPSPEQLEREFFEASQDLERRQLSREWDATIGDGLSGR